MVGTWKECRMLYHRLTQKAFHRWLKDPKLQQYDARFEDTRFEDFCVELIIEIARNEFNADRADMWAIDPYEFDDYVAEEFDFNLISADELIKEYESVNERGTEK